MIVVNTTMLHDKLIEIASTIEDPKLTLVSQTRMNVSFSCDDDQKGAAVLKKTLKGTKEFSAVYFQVNVK